MHHLQVTLNSPILAHSAVTNRAVTKDWIHPGMLLFSLGVVNLGRSVDQGQLLIVAQPMNPDRITIPFVWN